jgi:hypothetical protein
VEKAIKSLNRGGHNNKRWKQNTMQGMALSEKIPEERKPFSAVRSDWLELSVKFL